MRLLLRSMSLLLAVGSIVACGDMAAPGYGPETASGLRLADQGRTDYVIVIRPDAHPAEHQAAKELQSHLEAMTGASFPLVTAARADGPSIFVRISAQAGDVLAGAPQQSLGAEEILMLSVGRDLALAGGGPRGVLYAVYKFLENELGCRWYALGYGRNPPSTLIPKRPTLDLPPLDVRQKPAFEYRQIHCLGHMGNENWSVRYSLNGAVARAERDDAHGGDFLIRGIHNTLDLLRINMGVDGVEDTPGKLFAERPELFAEIDGRRRMTQVCATHQDLPAIYAPLLRAQVEQYHPARIGLTQMDGGGACRCERCVAANEQAGGPDVYSGSWLPMVNRAAELVPELNLWTFAYAWTRRPPRGIRPRESVYIWYCMTGLEHGLSTDLDDMYGDIATWGQLAPGRIFLWTYDFINNQVEFGYRPSLFVAERRLRRLHRIGVGGVFIQAGESWSTAASFSELQYYVLSHLLWDPYRDADQLIEGFLDAYYGAAAPYVQAYRQLNNALFLAHDPDNNKELRAGQSGIYTAIGDENVARLEGLLQQAEDAAHDDVIRMRVRMLRLPIWHYRLMKAGRPDWLALDYRGKNGTRRWYADQNEVNRTVSGIMRSPEAVPVAVKYLETMYWGDVRGFRESPIQTWTDGLLVGLRDLGIEPPLLDDQQPEVPAVDTDGERAVRCEIGRRPR